MTLRVLVQTSAYDRYVINSMMSHPTAYNLLPDHGATVAALVATHRTTGCTTSYSDLAICAMEAIAQFRTENI